LPWRRPIPEVPLEYPFWKPAWQSRGFSAGKLLTHPTPWGDSLGVSCQTKEYTLILRALVSGHWSDYLVGILNSCLRAQFLIDTGATHSLIPLTLLEKISLKPTVINGEKSNVIGECHIVSSWKGHLVRLPGGGCSLTCILGVDFLDGQNVHFDRDMNFAWSCSLVFQPLPEQDMETGSVVVAAYGQQFILQDPSTACEFRYMDLGQVALP
jgi:hypothetical protein